MANAPEKSVVTPRVAVRVAAGMGSTASIHGAPASVIASQANASAAPASSVPSWKFAKVFGVADVLVFADKTTFQFRKIERNDGNGFLPNSIVVTTDEVLANNLRAATKIRESGVMELTQPASLAPASTPAAPVDLTSIISVAHAQPYSPIGGVSASVPIGQ